VASRATRFEKLNFLFDLKNLNHLSTLLVFSDERQHQGCHMSLKCDTGWEKGAFNCQ